MVSPHIVGTFNFFLHFIFNSDVRFSVTTDAVVRAVTVTFKLGESVEENTVGKTYFMMKLSKTLLKILFLY